MAFQVANKDEFLQQFSDKEKESWWKWFRKFIYAHSQVSVGNIEDGLCCERVRDIFPFFDIYELLLKTYYAVHIFCITVKRPNYTCCRIACYVASVKARQEYRHQLKEDLW
jgi:hypothetical protein